MKNVSIIIPFYSHVDWLTEAIESVLAQTYPNYEIILINDGSKEDMTDFLQKYGDKIIYLVQENKGPAAARNNGIRHATGDLIAFHDADDIWLPTKLQKQVEFMEQSGTMWNHTGFYYWNPEKGTLKEVDCSRDYDDISIQRMVSTQIATPSVMIDRRIYETEDFYFPENLRNGEDDQLYTRLARKYKISLVEEPLVKVRLRGSNSNSHAVERFNLRCNNYQKWKSEGIKIPFMVHVIYNIYIAYSFLFSGISNSSFKDRIAKYFWALPYFIERVYIRILAKQTHKSEKYILRSE